MILLRNNFMRVCAGVLLVMLNYLVMEQNSKKQVADESTSTVVLIKNKSTLASVCHLPTYSPFDPRIKKYIKIEKKIHCGHPQEPLTFVDNNDFLHINQTALVTKKISLKKVQCFQQEVIRNNDDAGFRLGEKTIIQAKSNFLHEFAVVNCVQLPKKQIIYETGYAKIPTLPKQLAEKSKFEKDSGKTSVLILVLESTSRLNFIRQLPKTYKYIQEKLKGIIFKGLTKVGDNTYPNMLTLLTGLTYIKHKLEPVVPPFRGKDPKESKVRYDNLPAVWKNYSQNNYVTMFAEDFPRYAIFNDHSKGFKTPPTEFYMRPFWLAMEKQTKFKSRDERCYGHVPKHQFLLKYLLDFQKKMQQGRHSSFSFTFLSQLSHNSLNAIHIIDEELLELLKKFNSLGVFSNTLVLIMGDHGNRFDEIRQTKIGRVEERMPFLAINLPPSLEHFRPNLEQNVDVLTSWHDVYEMLMDVADNNTLLQSRQLRYGYKGLSLFRPIPNNRSCLEIGIPKEYCVCMVEQELNVNHAESIEAGRSFVQIINKIFSDNKEGVLCEQLQLDIILSAQKLIPPALIKTKTDAESEMTRVLARVKPSGALLEGTLQKLIGKQQYILIGDINRINKYGNQSSCVSTPSLKLICFCKK